MKATLQAFQKGALRGSMVLGHGMVVTKKNSPRSVYNGHEVEICGNCQMKAKERIGNWNETLQLSSAVKRSWSKTVAAPRHSPKCFLYSPGQVTAITLFKSIHYTSSQRGIAMSSMFWFAVLGFRFSSLGEVVR